MMQASAKASTVVLSCCAVSLSSVSLPGSVAAGKAVRLGKQVPALGHTEKAKG